jgi:hypothetical protein
VRRAEGSKIPAWKDKDLMQEWEERAEPKTVSGHDSWRQEEQESMVNGCLDMELCLTLGPEKRELQK